MTPGQQNETGRARGKERDRVQRDRDVRNVHKMYIQTLMVPSACRSMLLIQGEREKARFSMVHQSVLTFLSEPSGLAWCDKSAP